MNTTALNVRLREFMVELMRVRELPLDTLNGCVELLNGGTVPRPDELAALIAQMRAGVDPAAPERNLMKSLRGLTNGHEFEVFGHTGHFTVTTVLPVMDDRVEFRGHVFISQELDGSRRWELVHGIGGVTTLAKGIAAPHNKVTDIQLARDLWSALGV